MFNKHWFYFFYNLFLVWTQKMLLNLAKQHNKAWELENVQPYPMLWDIIKNDQKQYEVEVDQAPTTEQQKIRIRRTNMFCGF